MQIAIIGGGASGVVAALALLRAATDRDVVVQFEPAQLGEGVAYATTSDQLLLNVRAGNMSAYADEPGHFVAWLGQHHPTADSESFVPRRWYAQYLRDTLTAAIAASAGTYRAVTGSVTDIIPTGAGAAVTLADGTVYAVDQVVLAIGHHAPSNPLQHWGVAGARVLNGYDWQRIRQDVPPTAPVIIIGTGLTMVDTVVALVEHGHQGPIHAFSRRGYVPRVHVDRLSYPAVLSAADGARPLSELLRTFRQAVAQAAAAGVPWQAVVDSIRPHTQGLWQTFGPERQRRFLRHLRAYWDIHRHRIAPQIAAQLEQVRQSGQLRIWTGRAIAASQTDNDVRITLRTKHGTEHLSGAVVINCTGPSTDFGRLDSPLLNALRQRGVLNPDALRLGIASSLDGRLHDSAGQPIPWLWTLGPLRKGVLWECIAIPDIRTEARGLATAVLTATPALTSGGVR